MRSAVLFYEHDRLERDVCTGTILNSFFVLLCHDLDYILVVQRVLQPCTQCRGLASCPRVIVRTARDGENGEDGVGQGERGKGRRAEQGKRKGKGRVSGARRGGSGKGQGQGEQEGRSRTHALRHVLGARTPHQGAAGRGEGGRRRGARLALRASGTARARETPLRLCPGHTRMDA